MTEDWMHLFPEWVVDEEEEEGMGYWASAQWTGGFPALYLGVQDQFTQYEWLEAGFGLGLDQHRPRLAGFLQVASGPVRNRLEVDIASRDHFRYGLGMSFPVETMGIAWEPTASIRWQGGEYDSFRLGVRMEWPPLTRQKEDIHE